jgi:hypothetical protein
VIRVESPDDGQATFEGLNIVAIERGVLGHGISW